jgi:hypothetical protein
LHPAVRVRHRHRFSKPRRHAGPVHCPWRQTEDLHPMPGSGARLVFRTIRARWSRSSAVIITKWRRPVVPPHNRARHGPAGFQPAADIIRSDLHESCQEIGPCGRNCTRTGAVLSGVSLLLDYAGERKMGLAAKERRGHKKGPVPGFLKPGFSCALCVLCG